MKRREFFDRLKTGGAAAAKRRSTRGISLARILTRKKDDHDQIVDRRPEIRRRRPDEDGLQSSIGVTTIRT
jgi:hypothetical protein